MLTGKTKSGFEYQIDEKKLDDLEILEAVEEAENNTAKFPKVLSMVLGEEQKQRLYDHTRTKKGNVPVQKTIDLFIEIMEVAGEQTKNS